MARKLKLSWQLGAGGRKGRWRKKYQGRSYYFPCGRGKSDREAYDAAVTAWENKKVQLDAAAPKPHQADYERAIAEWETVLTWCRKHQEDEMADVAIAKLEILRRQLSQSSPQPLAEQDTFAGRFEPSVRYPKLQEAIVTAADQIEKATQSHAPFAHLPGYDEYLVASQKFLRGIVGSADPGGHKSNSVVVPSPDAFDAPEDLTIEREVWRDRIEVMQRSAKSPENTLKSHVESFLAQKQTSVNAGVLTPGRVVTLRHQLGQFRDWLGADTPVTEISGKTLIDYRAHVLKNVENRTWSRTTANERMSAVRSLVRWLWQVEAIASLPRVLDAESRVLQIGKSTSPIVVFTKAEIQCLLKEASGRTRLFILLMLNCGMTQKDIADLQFREVDFRAGRITRKRSKTRHVENVPEVSYLLWPQTCRLLQRQRSTTGQGRVLLNESGRPLWHEEVQPDGVYKKSDNIRNAFERLRRKVKINKSLKSLKKTSASLLRGSKDYKGLEDLFLGHAPQSMSDRHYAQAPQQLLDEAVQWLAEQYSISACLPAS